MRFHKPPRKIPDGASSCSGNLWNDKDRKGTLIQQASEMAYATLPLVIPHQPRVSHEWQHVAGEMQGSQDISDL